MPRTEEPGRLLITATIPEMHEVFLLPYARHMRSLGWKVDGMARDITSSEPCRAAYDEVHDINWSRNPLDPGNLFRVPKALRTVVDRGAYDIIHAHGPVAGFVTRHAMRAFARPAVIYTAHGFHFHATAGRVKNFVFGSLEKVAGRWTDELIVINSEDEAAARRRHLVRPGHLHHFPGIGVDRSEFSPARKLTPEEQAAERDALGLPRDVPLVLMVAEFIPRKRHEDALNAFTAVWGDAALLLVGKGPLEEEMRTMANSVGIGGRVYFMGYRDDVARIMALSDLVILPSSQEGLPRSVLEAMSMGVPVIATDIRGTRDLLADGAGVLIPVDSPAALAHAMNALLSNAQRRQELVQAAAARIEDYDLQHLLELHAELYADVLARERSALREAEAKIIKS